MLNRWIPQRGRSIGHVAFFSLLVALFAGCASASPRAGWFYLGHPGQVIQTPHYAIYTTIQNPQTTAELATLMEAALVQYQRLAPSVRPTGAAMPCYFFDNRSEWSDYTRRHTGVFAPLYLKINRGGYTIDDTFVAYLIGANDTYAVAAHEGFHQFIARNFKTRPPPFLEEGMASLFETIRWTDAEPRWDFSVTPTRIRQLRLASSAHQLWPLQTLCTMHAGDIVNLGNRRIETFYAQDWAFAQFLARDPQYAPRLKLMMRALADGSAMRFTLQPPDAPKDAWNPSSAKPMLEHYLGIDLASLNRQYASFIHQIVINNVPRGELNQ